MPYSNGGTAHGVLIANGTTSRKPDHLRSSILLIKRARMVCCGSLKLRLAVYGRMTRVCVCVCEEGRGKGEGGRGKGRGRGL